MKFPFVLRSTYEKEVARAEKAEAQITDLTTRLLDMTASVAEFTKIKAPEPILEEPPKTRRELREWVHRDLQKKKVNKIA